MDPVSLSKLPPFDYVLVASPCSDLFDELTTPCDNELMSITYLQVKTDTHPLTYSH